MGCILEPGQPHARCEASRSGADAARVQFRAAKGPNRQFPIEGVAALAPLKSVFFYNIMRKPASLGDN